MSFLPSRTVFEEKLVDNHYISGATEYYVSGNIFDMSVLSIQIVTTEFNPDSIVEVGLEQSNDGINFDEIDNSTITLIINGSTTIERSNFSGKFLRVKLHNMSINEFGVMNVFLIAKR